jgi:hypothetical protein
MTKIDLESVVLKSGAHKSPEDGMCLLEVVSMFAGEDFGDAPACVDPILAQFGRSWNDGMRSDAERAQLKQYIARLPGTNKGSALSQKRGWMALDWLIRVHTAAWLALNPGLVHHAETLKMLPPITCSADLVAAQPKIDAAKKDAAAAWAAARDAAWAAAGAAAGDAARDAAGAAAWAAARAAARDAAWDAARDAAWDAARDAAGAAAGAAARGAAWDAAGAAAGAAARGAAWAAAWAAARDAAGDAAKTKLEPTVVELQASAHDLFSRMIEETE